MLYRQAINRIYMYMYVQYSTKCTTLSTCTWEGRIEGERGGERGREGGEERGE